MLIFVLHQLFLIDYLVIMRDFLFIFSNRSGHIDSNILSLINQFIDENPDFNIEYLVTEHSNHLTEKILSFVKIYPNAMIIVAGGDGSLNEATNALVKANTNAVLCPIPFGTANDFCKILYEKYNFSNFLSELKNMKIKKIDLLKINGNLKLHGTGPDNVNTDHQQTIDESYVLNVASFGLDSKILQSAFRFMAKHPKISGSSYYLAVVKHFFKKHLETFQIQFEIDGKIMQEEILLSALCNAAYYGNGFNPAPNFDLFDGKLNYLIAFKLSHFEFAVLAVKYMNGKILQEKRAIHGFAKKVRIKSLNNLPIIGNFDGTLFKSNDFEISVVEKALPLAFVGDYAQRLLK